MPAFALVIASAAVIVATLMLASGVHVVWSRLRVRWMVAAQVLGYANGLGQHQLWVRVPFPEIEWRPWRAPGDQRVGPRRWQRVVGVEGGRLVMDDGVRLPPAGCDEYLYATPAGRAVSYYAVEITSLPPGIDVNSVLPPVEV